MCLCSLLLKIKKGVIHCVEFVEYITAETWYSEKVIPFTTRPYKILKHHTNGDITYEIEPNSTYKANIC